MSDITKVDTAAARGVDNLPTIKPTASVNLAFAGTSAQSSALVGTIVRVIATQNCWLAFGTNPTANTTTSVYLPSGAVEYFAITTGWKIAAIQDSAAGTLNITTAIEV